MVYLFEISYRQTSGLYGSEDMQEIEAEDLRAARTKLAERLSRLWGKDESQYTARLHLSRVGRLF